MKVPKELLSSLSQNIRATRERHGLTQEVVAERAGLSAAYYSQIELGNKSPSLYSLISIAKVLMVSLDSLVYGNTNRTAVQNTVRMLSHIDDSQIEKVNQVLFTLIKEFKLARESGGEIDGAQTNE